MKTIPVRNKPPLSELIESIASTLHQVKAYDLPGVCKAMGISDGDEAEAMRSKATYVRTRIKTWSEEELVQLSKRVQDRYPSDELQALLEQFDANQPFQISALTRQHLLQELAELSRLEGKLEIVEFIEKIWPVRSMSSQGGDMRCLTLADEIGQHMILNNDYSYRDLFDLVGLPTASNSRLVEFLEWTVHPLVRVDGDQEQSVSLINKSLKPDGFALMPVDQISGHPVYRMAKIMDGVGGNARNLIFASTGPKPEIVFSDAINNDIKLVKNEEFCLVYDRPLKENGLLWCDLVEWWAEHEKTEPNVDCERSLYARLNKSIVDSPPEKLLFRSYFQSLKDKYGERLPALIPQVYLHYDPYTLAHRGGRKVLPRQRMDFLLLLSPFQRIVIEVDGMQHYSENDKPSPKIYAEMVAADRELRLAGYEVYRFGGVELNETNGPSLIAEFFGSLFEKHGCQGIVK